MSRNLWLILGVSLLFGISTGIYEFVLPYFLQAHHISFQQMGWIFALASLAMVLARIYMGGLADRWGRKHLYAWALAVCGGATALAAPLPALLWQLLLKTLRETAALTRETIYPIILYEEGQAGFLDRIGKFRGMEYLFQAGGTLLAGILIGRLSVAGGISNAAYQLTLVIAGSAVLLGSLIWTACFQEKWRPDRQRPLPLRELFSFNLHPNLQLLAISGIIFAFGMQLSHSFYLPLFFKERFGQPPTVVYTIMVIHRITIALPLLVVGNLPLKNFRAWYIFGLLIEGATLGVSALLKPFMLSAVIFLLHDLVGAGIWSPIQATLIQRYSRNATRGIEVGKVLAWSSLGGVLGPIAAGWLAGIHSTLPFLFSGIFMAISALPLCWLNTHAPAPEEAPAAAEPAAA